MSQISAIISDWGNSDDATFTDLDQIIEIINEVDEILRDASEITKFIGYWMKGGDYVIGSLGVLIDFMAENDPYFSSRDYYGNFLSLTLVTLAIEYVIALADNYKNKNLPYNLDEIIKIGLALTIGVSGRFAYSRTDSDNKKLVANYFFKMGAGKLIPFAFELLIDRFWGNDDESDNRAEKFKSVLKTILWGLGFLPTIYYFEPLGWERQTRWALATLVYGLCRASWGWVGKVGGKPYAIVAIIAGAGLAGIIYLAVFDNPSH